MTRQAVERAVEQVEQVSTGPVPEAAVRLRAAGLRATTSRLAVLDVLAHHPHADVATVLELTRQRERGLSVQGVYDVLAALTDAGLLRRVQPGQSVARYELDRGDNHHHVVCRGCGAITDIPCSTGSPPCLDATRATSLGFVVEEAEVTFWGTCPRCRPGTPAEDGSTPGAGPDRRHPRTT